MQDNPGGQWLARHPIFCFFYFSVTLFAAIILAQGLVDHQWRWPSWSILVIAGLLGPLFAVAMVRRHERNAQLQKYMDPRVVDDRGRQ